MQRFLAAVAASLLLALVVPVAAHGSCREFGAVTAGGAQAGGFGQFVSSYATTGSGMISGIVAGEHVEFCAP